MMSKPKTKEEVREDFLYLLRELASYWANVDSEYHDTTESKILGAFHSLLANIDGCGMNFPAMDIVLRPHPDDMAYHIENDEDYFVSGMAINDDVMLHELLHRGTIK